MASLPGVSSCSGSHGATTMTMRGLILIASLGVCLVLPPAQAIGAEKVGTAEALKALGHEMSTCSAYFVLATAVLKSAHPDDTTITTRYDAAGKVMFAQALAIADVIGLEPDEVAEWSTSAMRDMVKEINADPKNSAALMTRKYDEPCQTLLKEAATRFRELIDRGAPD
jgi:hypothetical protein